MENKHMLRRGNSILEYMVYKPGETDEITVDVLDARHWLKRINKEDTSIVKITNLYVEPKKRGKGVATRLLKKIEDRYETSLVLTNAGAHIKEYPTEPEEKDLIDIADKVTRFYMKKGFLDVNRNIGGYEFKRTLVLLNDIGTELAVYLVQNE